MFTDFKMAIRTLRRSGALAFAVVLMLAAAIAAPTTIFSIMAVAFAVVGVAALIAYAVAQRTREIGVRMALGAQSHQVVALLVREGFWMTAGGLTVGVSAAWALRRSVASLLFGVSAADPITFTIVPVLLTASALIAIYVPARRAARIDPAVTLRHD